MGHAWFAFDTISTEAQESLCVEGSIPMSGDRRNSWQCKIIATRIPPPVYAFITAGFIWLLTRYVPALRWIGAPWNKLGWAFIAIGIGLDLSALLLFIRTHTTVNPIRPERASRLVVSGLFRVSRNPMYLGLVLALCGWAWLLGNPLCLVVVWLFARTLVIVQITTEEVALRERFGDSYREYSQQVNRWIGRKEWRLRSGAGR
jgi:protein-S-isoprenylcysteine O-methyltransferase Ste14